MNVNVRDLLPGEWSVVNAHGEILCRETMAESPLDLSNTAHEVRSFRSVQFSEALHPTMRHDQSVSWPPRKDVEEGVPPFPFCNFVRWNLTGEDSLKERGHASP